MKLNITSLSISATVVIWLIVVMTILSELSEPFKLAIAQLGGHHWVGKGVTAVVVFIIVYLVFYKIKESNNVFKNTLWVAASTILGGLIIFGFYLQHFISG